MRYYLQIYLNSYRGLSKPAWILAMIMLINRSGAMVIPFLGVYMIQSLHFGLKDTGTVLSCFGVGAVCGSWLGGWLTDKVGNFRVQFIALVLAAPILCILPELKTPLSLSLGVFLLSLSTETFRPANSVSIASYTNPENITKAFSLNRMAVNLGFSIGPALAGFIAAFSYPWLFYGNAISTFLAGIIFYFYFKNRRENKLNTEHKNHAAPLSISPWKDGHFLAFTFLCSLYGICFFQLFSTIPLFYRSQHQFSEWDIGLILAFSGFIVFTFEMIVIHFAEKRFSQQTSIVAGTLLCGISFIMLILPGKYFVLYASMFVLCMSEILAIPFMSTVTLKRAPVNKQGAFMGVNAIAFSASHIISPFFGTQIAANYGFDILWTATAILTGLTALGFWWVMNKMKIR